MESDQPIPLGAWTPTVAAAATLTDLADLWQELAVPEEADFATVVLQPLNGVGVSSEVTLADRVSSELTELYGDPGAAELQEKPTVIDMVIIASAGCVDAIRFDTAAQVAEVASDGPGREALRNRAWVSARDAAYWHGIALAHVGMKGGREKVLSALGRKAAEVRHTENRAMRQQVIDQYVAAIDKFPSMNAAAQAMAGKVVPVSFGTVRKWIGDYRKQLHAAGTP